MNNELVSFIIAAFNEEKYIIECVESCLKQTHSNIEVVITDDGSTDNTLSVLYDNFSGHKNVKICSFEKNKGKIYAYNNSFLNSNGKYIAIVGADDINIPTRIEFQIDYLRHYSLTMSDLTKVNSDNSQIILSGICKERYPINQEMSYRDLIYNSFGLPSILLHRKYAESIFPLPVILAHEDYWIPLWCAHQKSILYTVEPLYYYRMHENNLSGNNPNHQYSNEKIKSLSIRDLTYWEMLRKALIKKDEMKYIYLIDFHINMLSFLKQLIYDKHTFRMADFEYFLKVLSKHILLQNSNFDEGISLLHHTISYNQKFLSFNLTEISERITSIIPEVNDYGEQSFNLLAKSHNSNFSKFKQKIKSIIKNV